METEGCKQTRCLWAGGLKGERAFSAAVSCRAFQVKEARQLRVSAQDRVGEKLESGTKPGQVLPGKPKWFGWGATFTFAAANLVFMKSEMS